MRPIAAGLIAAASWAAMSGCAPSEPPPGSRERLLVLVGIAPEAYLVRRVGGGHVDVQVLLPAGRDPHLFAPGPRQMFDASRARLLVTVGLPFETRLAEKLAGQASGLAIVDAAAGVDGASENDHAGGQPRRSGDGHAEGDHGHAAGEDPHVWLSPKLLKVQAENIAAALERVDPAHGGDYRDNLRTLLTEIDAADRRIAQTLAPIRGRTVYVFHAALGHFAEAYGLRQKAVEVGGKPPSPRQLSELIAEARADRAKVLVVQPQFDKRSAEIVAKAIGCRLLAADPLAEDVLKNLETLAADLAAAH
jgi:zinc transport system substrate-binding protein